MMQFSMDRRRFLKLSALASLAAGGVHLAAKAGNTTAEAGRPNFLILVFDALSARNMSVYGYPRETTPHLTQFAERATVYHRHYAAGNHTSPGVASILTGTYPWSHRAFHLHGTVDEQHAARNLFREFSSAGYHTIGYSHNLLVTSLLHQFSASIELFLRTRDLCLVDDQFSDQLFSNDFNVAFWSEWLLLREGSAPPGSLIISLLHRLLRSLHNRSLIKEYGALFPRGLPHLHSLSFVLEDTVDWLDVQLRAWPNPFLAYVHVLPPHEPYTTRRDFVDRFNDGWAPPQKETSRFSEGHSPGFLSEQRRLYDEYLAYADAEFGRLYGVLAASGALDNTYLIVTADHGELFERGIRGHVTPGLYEPVVHVPLLVHSPLQEQRRDVYDPTNAVDLLPALLEAAGQRAPDWAEGQGLPFFSEETPGGQAIDNERSVFCVEAKSNPKVGPLTKASVALVKGQHKLTRYWGYGGAEATYELYDLAQDPEELEDLVPSGGPVVARLRQELDERLRQVEGA